MSVCAARFSDKREKYFPAIRLEGIKWFVSCLSCFVSLASSLLFRLSSLFFRLSSRSLVSFSSPASRLASLVSRLSPSDSLLYPRNSFFVLFLDARTDANLLTRRHTPHATHLRRLILIHHNQRHLFEPRPARCRPTQRAWLHLFSSTRLFPASRTSWTDSFALRAMRTGVTSGSDELVRMV